MAGASMIDKTISPGLFITLAIVLLGILLSTSLLLPHDRYYRYQSHDNISTRKADWIYERLHFDETPIDVALIGTSRMAGGLSGPLIQKRYCKATGREIHVANLAIPMTGRNMHYVVAKEAARIKQPTLAVIEINDVESRRPHPGFIFLADAHDVLTAPLMLNMNYFSDLIRLPGRQANLFAQSVLGKPTVRREFDPESYAGSNLDLTEIMLSIDGQIMSRYVYNDRARMNAMQSIRLENASPVYLLPSPLRTLEYRLSRIYINRIQHEITKIGAATEYAYLPAYGEPAPPQAMLEELGLNTPMFDLGGDAANDAAQWLNVTHFNADGARRASERFTDRLIETYPTLGQPSKGCG